MKDAKYLIDIEVDKLTNSIENAISGDSFPMGYIKEPEGVDFFVDSKALTEKERQEISDIITYYKLTGRKRKKVSLPVTNGVPGRK
jgi:hypothetical protein